MGTIAVPSRIIKANNCFYFLLKEKTSKLLLICSFFLLSCSSSWSQSLKCHSCSISIILSRVLPRNFQNLTGFSSKIIGCHGLFAEAKFQEKKSWKWKRNFWKHLGHLIGKFCAILIQINSIRMYNFKVVFPHKVEITIRCGNL